MDENVGIARPFSVLSVPPGENSPAAGIWGHDAHPTEMARKLHQTVMRGYPGSAPVITARSDGVLRCYAAFIQVNETLYSRDTGYDYTWHQKLPLYFEVLFYSAIELAQRSGVREIHYSYESDDTKASRGCELRPRLGYVKALDEEIASELNRLCAGPAAVLPARQHTRWPGPRRADQSGCMVAIPAAAAAACDNGGGSQTLRTVPGPASPAICDEGANNVGNAGSSRP